MGAGDGCQTGVDVRAAGGGVDSPEFAGACVRLRSRSHGGNEAMRLAADMWLQTQATTQSGGQAGSVKGD